MIPNDSEDGIIHDKEGITHDTPKVSPMIPEHNYSSKLCNITNVRESIPRPRPRIRDEDYKNLMDAFDRFWESYPKKIDKKRCSARWIEIFGRSDDWQGLYDAIMQGLERWKESFQWTEDDGMFVRSPLTWLENETWEVVPK